MSLPLDQYVNAVVVGIVEGVTEFLPVSSTGHMIVVEHLLGWKGEAAKSFLIFIQLGAIAAVLLMYLRRFQGLLPQWGAGLSQFSLSKCTAPGMQGAAGLTKLFLACAPASIVGVVLHKMIKEQLFSPLKVGIAFIVGAVFILIVERRAKPPVTGAVESLTVAQAFGIGMFQCLGLWPGMSRSGSTIIGGMLLGCSRAVAAEFSFLVAVPIMCGATGLDLIKSLPALDLSVLPLFAVGFVVAFVAALLTVKALVGFVAKRSLAVFAYYRLVAGAGIVIAASMGLLE